MCDLDYQGHTVSRSYLFLHFVCFVWSKERFYFIDRIRNVLINNFMMFSFIYATAYRLDAGGFAGASYTGTQQLHLCDQLIFFKSVVSFIGTFCILIVTHLAPVWEPASLSFN